MREQEEQLFASAPVAQAVLKLALPAAAGQIILVIYNMADTFFIGLTGSNEMLSAVTVCMPAFMILSAISNLFGVGGAAVIARMLGRKNRGGAGRVSSYAFWNCLGTTLVYSLVCLAGRNVVVDLLGGSAADVHAYAVQYLVCTVAVGGLGTAMNMLLAHLLRAEGHAFAASFGIALGGFLNIGLDPLLMFRILPPGHEVLGAAAATAASNLAVDLFFLLVLKYNFRRGSSLAFSLGKARLPRETRRDVITTGLPACLMTLCENISYAVLDKLMSAWGVAAQAGLGVAKKINMLSHSMVRGIAQGVLPLLGYNFAAGNYKRMRACIRTSAAVSVSVTALCTCVFFAFSRSLTGLFIQNTSPAVGYGAGFLRILSVGAPFSAFAYSVISFFQAVGQPKRSFWLAVLRKGILDIPLMFALGALFLREGITAATPVTDILCCGIAAIWLRRYLRQFGNRGMEGDGKA